MKRNVLALALLGAAGIAGVAFAVDQTIDVSARLRVGLAFSNAVNMNFTPGVQRINFYGTPSGSDHVTMGPDGVVAADTSVFEPTVLSGTPASVDFTGEIGAGVNISCSASATLGEAVSSTTITVDQLRLSFNTADDFSTPDYTCAGAGTSPQSYTILPANTIYMGGRLVGNSTIQTNTYSTTTGGTAATIRVVYQ